MSVTKEKVQDLIKEFGKNDNDSGATESQVAVITERIKNITSHLKNNKKDHSGRRGLVIWYQSVENCSIICEIITLTVIKTF